MIQILILRNRLSINLSEFFFHSCNGQTDLARAVISAKSVPPDPVYIPPRPKLPKSMPDRKSHEIRFRPALSKRIRSGNVEISVCLNNPYLALDRRSNEVLTDNCLLRREDFR